MMHELFPVLAGLIIGALTWQLPTRRPRTLALVLLSIIAGVTASFISGELFVSWDFLLVDIPAVFLAALGMVAGVGLWQRRTVRF
jgi:1,4-dihydroxy-2-naphthoate octaprenyltransferase